MTLEVYAEKRAAFRKKLLDYKKKRIVYVGPHVSLHFAVSLGFAMLCTVSRSMKFLDGCNDRHDDADESDDRDDLGPLHATC